MAGSFQKKSLLWKSDLVLKLTVKIRNDEEKNNIFVFPEALKRGYITKKGYLVLSTELIILNYPVILSPDAASLESFFRNLTPLYHKTFWILIIDPRWSQRSLVDDFHRFSLLFACKWLYYFWRIWNLTLSYWQILSLSSQKLRKEVEDSQQKLAETKAKLQSVESKSGWFERRLAETEVFEFLTLSRTFNFNLFCEIPVLILPLSYQTFPCRLERRILRYIVMAACSCYVCLYLLPIVCEVCYGPSISSPIGYKSERK